MKRSGLLLIGMTLWWVLPFFIGHLFTYPFRDHFSSHLLYLVVITVALLAGLLLSALDARTRLWTRLGYWGKYALLCGAYAAETIVVLVLLIALDARRVLTYFGGDAEGSVGMLLIPSILFHVLAGTILGVFLALHRRK
ncbi:MAG TPA: hypothetical protein PKI11_19560 [Candidatus Hydrogenedentes bacterium]|nr:hypothetical protein [Candidatus Hydrogenedentota bacterium]HNT89770.1 hypothetical protein [Candidatus Hydrogenedentota bacterium]